MSKKNIILIILVVGILIGPTIPYFLLNKEFKL